jgi:hypothetical protein
MTRLVLAVLVVAALAALLAILALGLRATVAHASAPGSEASAVQKVAFALLAALILYVAFQGAG